MNRVVTRRDTGQRRAIRAAFERANRPLGPAEVLAAASEQKSGIGIATVYRTIKSLTEEGWLVPVDLPGESPRYELAGKSHHHHFHCRNCGRVFELEGCPDDLENLVPRGFRITGHEVVLYGQCPDCSRTRRN